MSKETKNTSNQNLLVDFNKLAECLLVKGQYDALITICNEIESLYFPINYHRNSNDSSQFGICKNVKELAYNRKLENFYQQCKFQEVLDISSEASIEFPNNSKIIILKAKSLFALERFEESLHVSQELQSKLLLHNVANILSSMSRSSSGEIGLSEDLSNSENMVVTPESSHSRKKVRFEEPSKYWKIDEFFIEPELNIAGESNDTKAIE